MQKVSTSQDTLLTGQRSLDAKQEEVLLTQKMTNQYLQKIDTSINALKTNSLASSPYSTNAATPGHIIPSFPCCPESLAHYVTPPKSGFAHLLPAHANVTIIAGNHVVNNINKVTNNSQSHQVTTINTINSYNTYKAPAASSNTKGTCSASVVSLIYIYTPFVGNRGRRQRPSISPREVCG